MKRQRRVITEATEERTMSIVLIWSLNFYFSTSVYLVSAENLETNTDGKTKPKPTPSKLEHVPTIVAKGRSL